jgi:hypothetical protein
MPKETDRLKLPLPLGNETVSRESINGIFEKIDAGVATQADLDTLREAVSKMDIPDASLTQKGKVQLSSKTDGTSETVAATEKAVRDARVAAETNAKNASLPRTGGDISGPLTVSSWGSISAGTSGFFLMGHNCYIHPTNNKYYFKQTHSNIGARGIIFRLGQAGVYTFDTGPTSTVKDSEFTPTLIRMPTQTDYDALFQSGVDAKKGTVDAINANGGNASINDTWAALASKISLMRARINASDEYALVNNISRWTTSSRSPVQIMSAKVYFGGTYRVRFTLATYETYVTGFAQIYVNGTARGVIRSTGRSSMTFVEDITVNPDDEIQLRLWTTQPTGESTFAYVDNVSIHTQTLVTVKFNNV